MQTQYSVLDYRIDSEKNIDYEMKRWKAIEQEFVCMFIRIDSDKADFNVFKAINEIF